MHRGDRSIVIGGASLALVFGVLALLGIALWPSLVLAIASVALAVPRRAGVGAAIGIAALAVGGGLLLLLVVTAASGIPIVLTVAAASAATTVVSLVAAGRSGALVRPSTGAIATVAPAAAAAAAVPLLALVGWLRLGADSLAWVMRGDGALFLTVAWRVVADGGVVVDVDANAVPLTTALIAVAVSPGRDAATADALLEHDLAGLAVLWAGFIGLAGMLAGIVVATIVRAAGARPLVVAVAGAGAGLLPLGWVFGGYPIQYGFVNAHIALAILLASIIVALGSARLAATVGALASACVLLFATWSPLALIPFVLAIAIVVHRRHELRDIRAAELVVVLGASAVVAVWVLGAVLPGLLAGRGEQLTDATAIAEDVPPLVLPVAVAATVALAAVARSRPPGRLFAVAIGLGAAALVGMLALLIVTDLAWTYYPRKLAWLALLPVLVVGIGAATAVALRGVGIRRRALAPIVAGAVAIAALAGTGTFPIVPGGFDAKDLAVRMTTGGVMADGDSVAATVLALAHPEQPSVLWRSGRGEETMITYWLLMVAAGQAPPGSPLLELAYTAAADDGVERLCEIAAAAGPGLQVRTADPGLETEAAITCAGAGMRFSPLP